MQRHKGGREERREHIRLTGTIKRDFQALKQDVFKNCCNNLKTSFEETDKMWGWLFVSGPTLC